MLNQCDGCMADAPLAADNPNMHVMFRVGGNGHVLSERVRCQKERYEDQKETSHE